MENKYPDLLTPLGDRGLEKYTQQLTRLPKTGKQIIAQTEGQNIIVYQAFNPNIASYAVANQRFGGSHYSFNRMSWIKPGFLWMMYRAGWAAKEPQQHILRISLPMQHFGTILSNATKSTYDETIYGTRENWQQQLAQTEVRLQWDPDHDPLGVKQERKAIQLGMKGNVLKQFATEWIDKIEDITPFVKEQHSKILAGNINDIDVPFEKVIAIDNEALNRRIGIQ